MPSDRNVYLAGPIVGVEYGKARFGWRREFEQLLHWQPYWSTENDVTGHVTSLAPSLRPETQHIHLFSPMRGRLLMDAEDVVAPGVEYTLDDPLENAKSMLLRDTNDIRYCDLVVVNLVGATRAALGTTAEMGFAYALNKPVVLIMEKDPSVFHYHGFITGIASFWVETVPEAVDVVKTLLTPGV